MRALPAPAQPEAVNVTPAGDRVFAGSNATGRVTAWSTADGATLSSMEIESQPVFDGMALASGKLFMATVDGKIVCYGETLIQSAKSARHHCRKRL